jgi:hypothetical protein
MSMKRNEALPASTKGELRDYRSDIETTYDLSGYLASLREEFAIMRKKRAIDPYPESRYSESEEKRMELLESKFLDLVQNVCVSDIPLGFTTMAKIGKIKERNVLLRIIPRMTENAFANTDRVGYTGAPGWDISDKFFPQEDRRGIDAPFAYSIDAQVFDADARAGKHQPQWVTLGVCGFRVVPNTENGKDVLQVDHLGGPDKFLRVDDELGVRKLYNPGWGAALWTTVQFARSCGIKQILIRKAEASYWEKVREKADTPMSPYAQIVRSEGAGIRHALKIRLAEDDPAYPAHKVFEII